VRQRRFGDGCDLDSDLGSRFRSPADQLGYPGTQPTMMVNAGLGHRFGRAMLQLTEGAVDGKSAVLGQKVALLGIMLFH